ncbi:Uu.00g120090.m01.CDS01 [Anthostomella pinea]|uniref:Uu.00g120090.m01.CDS01 n=1 Tax=Anthostomella pinea TaxID=933095 RepID=A0AAI8VHQ4_9PEZI|nr:Uu.00g120090.m01.CDS01 [Anthostomella pinea]
MKAILFMVHAMAGMAAAAAIRPNARGAADSDEAVVYPASVDQSWVDARSDTDSDEAVVYPASVDQSWVDASAE